LRKFLKVYGSLILIAGTIIALDQLTKTWVRSSLSFSETWTPAPWLAPYFQIVYWRNTGAAFGIFQELGFVFTILAIVISLAIIYYYPRIPLEDWQVRLALAMQFSGAVGNLIDRLTLGYVTDFISLLPAWSMPVFNIADASITGGVVFLIYIMWKRERVDPTAEEAERESVKGNLPEEPCGE
jgi:signal peptidase II